MEQNIRISLGIMVLISSLFSIAFGRDVERPKRAMKAEARNGVACAPLESGVGPSPIIALSTIDETGYGWDETRFGSMTAARRYRFVHDFPFGQLKSDSEQSMVLGRMLAIAEAKNDRHSVLAVKYYICRISGGPGFMIPGGKTGAQLYAEMEMEARELGFSVEEIVARHYIANDLSKTNPLTIEQQYVENLKTFERMQVIGFDHFKDYEVEAILFHLAYFLWELEDFEKAYESLKLAERYVEPNEQGGYYYTQVLSYLQAYWKQKKDFSKSIEYTRKILQFHENFEFEDPRNFWWSRFWQGLANIEMAGLLIEQGKISESEGFANEGYKLTRTQEHVANMLPYQSEFDAIMVLVPIKLRLDKMSDAGSLLQRALFLKEKLELAGQMDYFRPLDLHMNLSKYFEMQGNPARALYYSHLAEALEDSLYRRNDARKFAQAHMRHEAEKYAERLKAVENEKQIQELLRNGTIVILLLVVVLAYGNYQRVQYQQRQKEKELEAATRELALLTQGLREKSEMIDNLKLENQKLLEFGNRSEYLDQLTRATILTDDDWIRFRELFEKVYPGYIAQQREYFPHLTQAELRMLVLAKLGLNSSEMANMLGVNRNTVNQTKLRLRKKTGMGV